MQNHGAVLGIDVGFSQARPSSAVCRLEWTTSEVTWTVTHFRAAENLETVTRIAGAGQLLVAAFDGPIRSTLDEIGKYRAAEQMLTRRLQRIGKPGQASSPSGRKLNLSTNGFATIVLQLKNCSLCESFHSKRIHEKALVEAFPTSFLGMMIDHPDDLDGRRGKRSDTYFMHLANDGTLEKLVAHCLPNRSLVRPFDEIKNHDDRAALVCALSALCVAVNKFVAVGDNNGWIILPPRQFIQAWAFAALAENEKELPGALHVESRSQSVDARTVAHQETYA